MKKRQIVIYMFVIFVLLCTSVYATISGEINVSASKETLKKGEEFAVTLSLSNLKADNGIDAIEGYIDIDKNILNNLTVSSINTVDGNVKINEDNILKVYDASDVNASNTDTGIVFNTNPVSGKGDYRLVINLAKALTSGTDLVKITFKVKDNVNDGTYNNAIKYKLFAIYSGTSESIEVSDKSINVIVNNSASDNNNNNEENTNNNVNNNNVNNNNENNIIANNNVVSNNNVTNNSLNNVANQNQSNIPSGTNQNNTTDNTTSNTPLPNTGYRIVLIPVIMIAIVGIVFYKKYSKYDNI